jgi:hypothetical protein
MNLKNMTTRISRKHLIAVALIIAFGGVAGGFILHGGQGASRARAMPTRRSMGMQSITAPRQTKHMPRMPRTAIPSTMPRQAARERTVERSYRRHDPCRDSAG